MSILGRNSNHLSVGIVGLANIGKSTFFQSLTNSKLGNPANYPFATIEPTNAITTIPNDKLLNLFKFYHSQKITYSTLNVIDIAGLTKGASDGKGMGNKFLNDIKSVDGLFHLVRGFKDDQVAHLEQTVDPVRDMGIVQDELILKDLNQIESIIDQNGKKLSRLSKDHHSRFFLQLETKFLSQLNEFLYNGQKISNFKKLDQWSNEELQILNKYNFLTSKPSLILLNVNEEDYLKQNYYQMEEILNWKQFFAPSDKFLLFSNKIEMAILNSKNKQFESVFPKMLNEMKSMLQLISFYTCGPLEVKQWNIRNGTTAQNAAGIIHTDLKDTFINAEVIHYSDMFNNNLKPKLHKMGKSYLIQDNDVIYFKSRKGKN